MEAVEVLVQQELLVEQERWVALEAAEEAKISQATAGLTVAFQPEAFPQGVVSPVAYLVEDRRALLREQKAGPLIA